MEPGAACPWDMGETMTYAWWRTPSGPHGEPYNNAHAIRNDHRLRRRWATRRARLVAAVATSLCAGFALCGVGCAVVNRPKAAPYWIAVRYDVEPLFATMETDEAIATIREDFQEVARIGFNAVFLRHLADDDADRMFELARESELRVVLQNRNFDRYVSAGWLPPGVQDVGQLPSSLPRKLLSHEVVTTLGVMLPEGRAPAERYRRLASSLKRSGVPCLTLGGAGGIVPVDASDDGHQDSSPTERWLDAFHQGIIHGSTRGLVLNRYRRLPGDPPGLSDTTGPHATARMAALREIIDRARRWGRLINGFDVRDVSRSRAGGVDTILAVLSKGRRRFVMVYNPSAEAFARGRIVLPEHLDGAPATRAVEVPPTASTPAGRVVTGSAAGIAVPVSLRPGDAVLYEVF